MRNTRPYTHLPMQFLLWLRKSKANKAGTAPIMLRIFLSNEVRAEYSTRIRCRPEEWNAAKGQLRATDEASRTHNVVLKKLEARARLLADRLQDERDYDQALPAVLPADVAAALAPARPRKPVGPTLLEFFAAASAQHLASKHSTAAIAQQAQRYLAKWPGGAGLRLADFKKASAQDFISWFASQALSPTTRRMYVAALSSLLTLAAPDHPPVLSKLKQERRATKIRRALSLAWLKKLQEAALRPAQALARDVFFLQFYLHGSRVGAVLRLRKDQVDWTAGRVRFITQKVVLEKDVALHGELRTLLLRYQHTPGPMLLPLLPTNFLGLSSADQYLALRSAKTAVRDGLRRAGRHIGWPGSLHPHLARHSLALRAYQVSGDLRLAQEMLGHADIAMTAKYIASLSTDELDSGAASVYDSLL